MAGEGIEHAREASKLYYRRLPMDLKRRKDNFRNIARLHMSTDSILTLERCRKFYKRARRYIVNHNILDNEFSVPAEIFFHSSKRWQLK